MPSSASNDYLALALETRCDQGRLVDSLRTLLGFYYQPNETESERARQIALFVADLSEMSDDNVWWAIREWRRTQDRRPSPATLRQLCMMRRHEVGKALKGRQPQESAAPYRVEFLTEEERAHRKAVVAKAAASCGFVQNKHGQWELPDDNAPKRMPHWSETANASNPLFAETLAHARAGNPLIRKPEDAA